MTPQIRQQSAMQARRGSDMPQRTRAAAGVLAIVATVSWLAIVLGDPGENPQMTDLESFGFDDSFDADQEGVAMDPHLAKLPEGAKGMRKSTQLEFEKTLAAVPEINPLEGFNADFLGGAGTSAALKGFPATTGAAEWPFTKQPLLGFDEGFKASWTGSAELPDNNVYASFPAHYPYKETAALFPSIDCWTVPDHVRRQVNTRGYEWENVGGAPEDNVFKEADYQFPPY
ncbi:hypothetical protein T484DRAFT_1764214 [Baffinella frigidus]|nr:hypothetical protein T484DRAFT_1764214 [Cryptophyta sp. CCMP2293]